MERKKKPMRFSNWPMSSPQRPRSPSSAWSSSSRLPSFSSDITDFYDAAEDWSENMEQGTYYREESAFDYCHPKPCAISDVLQFTNLKAFKFKKLKRVTNNFHPHRFVGEGGFGTVYKGWIHEKTFTPSSPGSGMAVAVKIIKSDGQGLLQGPEQWRAVVFYLGQLRHPNIVKFIGFCSENKHLALVYEYAQRGSLGNYLFKGNHLLSWTLRIKVAIGVAKALSFLHDAELPTIFRDVKSSKEFNAKLTDFGLAIAGPAEDETHISTAVLGTYGYAAPEYIATGDLYVKSDVYGFGVLLLELLSGLRAIDSTRLSPKHSLVEWAKPYLGHKEKLTQFMDPKLGGQYPEEGANEVAQFSLQCLEFDPEVRPRMSDIAKALEGLRHWNGPICPSGWPSLDA